MVLAYEDDGGDSKKANKREIFEKNLKEQGLHLETELKTVSNIILNKLLMRDSKQNEKWCRFAFAYV